MFQNSKSLRRFATGFKNVEVFTGYNLATVKFSTV